MAESEKEVEGFRLGMAAICLKWIREVAGRGFMPFGCSVFKM